MKLKFSIVFLLVNLSGCDVDVKSMSQIDLAPKIEDYEQIQREQMLIKKGAVIALVL